MGDDSMAVVNKKGDKAALILAWIGLIGIILWLATYGA